MQLKKQAFQILLFYVLMVRKFLILMLLHTSICNSELTTILRFSYTHNHLFHPLFSAPTVDTASFYFPERMKTLENSRRLVSCDPFPGSVCALTLARHEGPPVSRLLSGVYHLVWLWDKQSVIGTPLFCLIFIHYYPVQKSFDYLNNKSNKSVIAQVTIVRSVDQAWMFRNHTQILCLQIQVHTFVFIHNIFYSLVYVLPVLFIQKYTEKGEIKAGTGTFIIRTHSHCYAVRSLHNLTF